MKRRFALFPTAKPNEGTVVVEQILGWFSKDDYYLVTLRINCQSVAADRDAIFATARKAIEAAA